MDGGRSQNFLALVRKTRDFIIQEYFMMQLLREGMMEHEQEYLDAEYVSEDSKTETSLEPAESMSEEDIAEFSL